MRGRNTVAQAKMARVKAAFAYKRSWSSQISVNPTTALLQSSQRVQNRQLFNTSAQPLRKVSLLCILWADLIPSKQFCCRFELAFGGCTCQTLVEISLSTSNLISASFQGSLTIFDKVNFLYQTPDSKTKWPYCHPLFRSCWPAVI